ncbi:efflux RND transporter periplasmic adaptor subunit [Spirulina subsalsa]|uniref:efflux RND transporter periplasmic adaptor subunit n=1 Tax=Spirulina subsalsa TaxID=54311 RepID=UPI0003672D9E|nr:efflux RND transporter periplasmic adaptor subunit [Spirulina subsalsa]
MSQDRNITGQPDPESGVMESSSDPSATLKGGLDRALSNSAFRKYQGKTLLLGIGIGVSLAVFGMQVIVPKAEEPATAQETPQTEPNGSSQTITTALVERTAVERTLEATGTVRAQELIPVFSEATGLKISRLLVDEGSMVQQGQLMAVLESSVLEAQLAQAQASVAQAEARVAELRAGARSEELTRAREAVRSAEAGVAQAQSNYDLIAKRVESNQKLVDEGAIARDRFDELLNQKQVAFTNIQQAQASREDANARLQEVSRGPRPEVISQAEAQLAQAKGQVQLIRAQLNNTRVVAPRSGQVLRRHASVGNLTSSSQELFQIVENGRLEVQFTVPETQLSQIQPGQAVEIVAENQSGINVVGRVREIEPSVNENSRQAVVRVDLPSAEGLKPGMFLRGRIVVASTAGITVPSGAVLPQPDGSGRVFILQGDNTVQAQRIEMGELLDGDRVEILSGLQVGQEVAVKGVPYLKDGDRITVRNN